MPLSTITSSIGTTGRDFSTITLWEADHSSLGAQAYDSSVVDYDDTLVPYDGIGNDLIGEVFNDSVFDEFVTFDDSTPNSIKLTVPVAERHDGTAGTGARIERNSDTIMLLLVTSIIEWLELKSTRTTGLNRCFNTGGTMTVTIRNVIAHNTTGSSDEDWGGIHINTFTVTANILNSLFYNHSNSGVSSHLNGGGTETVQLLNCTFFKTGTATGEDGVSAGQNYTVKNCISTDSDIDDYQFDASSTHNNNLSSDLTADGLNSLPNKTSANQFVSTIFGSEDLHLKAGADAIEAGVDLGTTPTGVNIDIDGQTRPLGGVDWDMGADETILAPAVDGFTRVLRSPLEAQSRDTLRSAIS